MKEVIIDGVRYVPVTSASVDAPAILAGLIVQFWGSMSPTLSPEKIREQAEGLYIDVNEEGVGAPVEEVVCDIIGQIEKMDKQQNG